MNCLDQCLGCGKVRELDKSGDNVAVQGTSATVHPNIGLDTGFTNRVRKWSRRLCWSRIEKKEAAVYYVKGSRVPVEHLGMNRNHDSRCFYPSPCRNSVSSSAGNPGLVFLLNWQTIPPLMRLAVLQRAVHSGSRSLLPVIREAVGQEGGDSPNRDSGGRNAAGRNPHPMTDGDTEELRDEERPQERLRARHRTETTFHV